MHGAARDGDTPPRSPPSPPAFAGTLHPDLPANLNDVAPAQAPPAAAWPVLVIAVGAAMTLLWAGFLAWLAIRLVAGPA